MVLHTVNKSPLSSQALASCLRLATPNSALLLIEDGVYAATDAGGAANPLLPMPAGLKIFALQEDLQARGLCDRLLPGIETVDYPGFVELTCRYSSVQNWL